MPSFTITGPLEYINWQGRERECEATVRYSFDGEGDPVFVSCVAHSDDDEAQDRLDDVVDDWIADACDADYAEWLESRDGELATASGATVPPGGSL